MKRIVWVMMLMVGLSGATMAEEARGYLGVSVRNVEKLDDTGQEDGVFIDSIYAGSGAEAAGLQAEDKIVRLQGVTIRNMGDLSAILDRTAPGEQVELEVLRGNDVGRHVVILGQAPQSTEYNVGRWVVSLDETPRMGIEVETLNAQLANYFEVDAGVLVKEVHDGRPAFVAGLSAGDVVIAVDGQPVGAEDDIRGLLRERQAGDVVDVTVKRRGQTEVYDVVLEESHLVEGGPFKVAIDVDTSAEIHAEYIEVDLAPVVETKGERMTITGNTLTYDDPSPTISAQGSVTLERVEDYEARLRSQIAELEQQLKELRRELAEAGGS